MATVILKAGGVNGRLGRAAGRRRLGRLRRGSRRRLGRLAVAAAAGPGRAVSASQQPGSGRRPASCDQPLQHRVQPLAAGGRRPRCVGVDLEEAGLDQRRERRLAQRRHGIGAGRRTRTGARSMPSASRNPIINASSTRSCPVTTEVVSAVPWPLALDRLQPGLRPARPPRRALGLARPSANRPCAPGPMPT